MAVLAGHLDVLTGGGVVVDGLVAHVQGELLRRVVQCGGAVSGDVVHGVAAVVGGSLANLCLLGGGVGVVLSHVCVDLRNLVLGGLAHLGEVGGEAGPVSGPLGRDVDRVSDGIEQVLVGGELAGGRAFQQNQRRVGDLVGAAARGGIKAVDEHEDEAAFERRAVGAWRGEAELAGLGLDMSPAGQAAD